MAAALDFESRVDMSLDAARSSGASGRSGKVRRSGSSAGANDKRVFVGNLSWSTTWQELKDHMSRVGRVTRADVIPRRDGKSSGGGIVEYENADDAARARSELHDSELGGRPIIVREDREGGAAGPRVTSDGAASTVRPVSTTGGNPRVYVGNLAWDVAWQDLKDAFSKVGPVVHADVLTMAGGRSRGCGIVEFRSAADAGRAIATMNDTMLKGRQMFVREDRESKEFKSATGGGPSPAAGASGGVAVYFGNLSWDTTWQQLKDFAKGAGGAPGKADIAVGTDGRSRGYGIVHFPSEHDADTAIARLNGRELGGRAVEVRMDKGGGAASAPSGGSAGGGARVRMTNLPEEFGWQQVKDVLRGLGFDPTAFRTDCAGGVATISCPTAADAGRLTALSGATVNGRVVGIHGA